MVWRKRKDVPADDEVFQVVVGDDKLHPAERYRQWPLFDYADGSLDPADLSNRVGTWIERSVWLLTIAVQLRTDTQAAMAALVAAASLTEDEQRRQRQRHR